ncbi:hypothetical protein IKQ38_01100 [Candidatus Saccharibacteria bacterium]|nr:hypothetical protein [Candidatus Saccharibacteria bacterium]
MKICICCSLSFSDEVKKIAAKLEAMGHEVLLPNGILLDVMKDPNFDPVKAKTCNGYNAIRDHFSKILEADAMLICNYTKKRIKNYIGANTFLEAGFAYYHEKPIYALNPLPNQKYIHDEIHSFGIKVLNGDLSGIK